MLIHQKFFREWYQKKGFIEKNVFYLTQISGNEKKQIGLDKNKNFIVILNNNLLYVGKEDIKAIEIFNNLKLFY